MLDYKQLKELLWNCSNGIIANNFGGSASVEVDYHLSFYGNTNIFNSGNVCYEGSMSNYVNTVTNFRGVSQSNVATTTELTDITSNVNTMNKQDGTCVFNTTTNQPVWASGRTAGSVWYDATGATAHTPT